jgi:hypothetical protein
MDLSNLKKNLSIDINEIVNETDSKHLANYKNLIIFLENSLNESVADNTLNYSTLQSACFKCIRYLDQVIQTYSVQKEYAEKQNKTVENIFSELIQEESAEKKLDQVQEEKY